MTFPHSADPGDSGGLLGQLHVQRAKAGRSGGFLSPPPVSLRRDQLRVPVTFTGGGAFTEHR